MGITETLPVRPAQDQLAASTKNHDLSDQGMGTSVKGVYAAGDITLKPLRQVVTAAADGATAIYSIQNYLMEQM